MKVDSLINLAEIKKIKYSLNEPMNVHTSFKIGGKADIFLLPTKTEQLFEILLTCKENNIPYFILGNGSNLLVSDDGIEGAVISMTALNEIKLISETDIFAQSGASLTAVCVFACNNGLEGLEFAYGIPGSVGGALYMNAGAYGGEMAQVVSKAESICPEKYSNIVRNNAEMKLGYRKSIYEENGELITGIVFSLKKGDKKEISFRMDNFMNKRKSSQPLDFPSAGSTFKRPEGYFAAALIDECGLKGTAVGGAMVSEKHAGFIINKDKATCNDVLDLIEEIKNTVKKEKGVLLQTEVIHIGR